MNSHTFRSEAERFLRHAFVPVVTAWVVDGKIAEGDATAVLEALTIGGAFAITFAWSKWKEKREKPDV